MIGVGLIARSAISQHTMAVGGQVIGLAINGAGAVVTPGMRLLDIVPVGESLPVAKRPG